jgi:hypothetical protein
MERVLGLTGAVRWRDDSGRTFEADIYTGPAKTGVSGGGTSDDGKNAILTGANRRNPVPATAAGPTP